MFKIQFKKTLINMSIKNKLLLIYLLCVLIPVILTFIIFLSITGNNIKAQQKEQIAASLQRTKIQLSKGIDDITITAYNLLSDRILNEALEKEYGSYNEYFEEYSSLLRDALKKNNLIVKVIHSVSIYTDNKTIPDSDGYIRINDSIRKSIWYQYIDKPQGNLYKYYLVAYEENGKRSFSLLKVLNYFNRSGKNVLKIDFNDSEIIRLLNSEIISGQVYLVDDSNRIIYSTDKKYQSTPGDVFPVYDSSRMAMKGDYVFSTKMDAYSDLKYWKLIMIVNGNFATNAFRGPVKLILGMGSIFLLFAFAMIYIISYSFKYRLDLLRKHINTGRHQNFQVIECSEGTDEIGDVIREFNRMTKKIQQLITDICEVTLQKKTIELERRQAEINALQSQINPHFLYNLLESIRMRSVLKNETETARIIKYVSKMFRRLLRWEDDMITVNEELSYIGEFLEVQKYRFGDKLTYDISIDDAANDIKIPKMIFQPLVENACIHGLEKTKNGGNVSVSVKLSDSRIICTISDNGIGISEARLKEIYEGLQEESAGNGSIAIKNVYKRLNLLYGDKSQLRINSVEGEGTSVFVSIPAAV